MVADYARFVFSLRYFVNSFFQDVISRRIRNFVGNGNMLVLTGGYFTFLAYFIWPIVILARIRRLLVLSIFE